MNTLMSGTFTRFMLAGNVWQNINNGANYMSSNATTTTRFVAIAVIVIAGLMWLFGGQAAQKAKGILVAAIIGASLVLLAPSIIPAIFTMFGGASF